MNMDGFESYYDILEVPASARPDEIKKSFHDLARQYHPDTNSKSTERVKKLAEDKFKQINEAYNVLNDPKKRKLYDSKLKDFELRNRNAQQARTPSYNQPSRPTNNTGQQKQQATSSQSTKAGGQIKRSGWITLIIAGIFVLVLISDLGSSTPSNHSSAVTNQQQSQSANSYNYQAGRQSTKDSVSNVQSSPVKEISGASSTGDDSLATKTQACQQEEGQYASYNSASASCVCMKGYVPDGNNQCVTYNDSCTEIYSNSTWDGSNCTCSDGYVWNSKHTACILQSQSNDDVCQSKYGSTSYYTGQTSSTGNIICDCSHGSSWNKDQTACVSNAQYDQSCKEKYGDNTYYTGQQDSSGKTICDCKSGYYWNQAKTACYSTSQYNQQCTSNYGMGSSYSTYSNSCECDYGYTWSASSNWCVKNQ